jgi:hypothetical protein
MAKKSTPKSKRSTARRSLRDVVRCDHYWNYKHSLWQAREGYEEVAAGRYCSKCGKMETAVARNWHQLPKSYVYMRETLEASIKASNCDSATSR